MITIIIPTLNEEKYLPRLLESIAQEDSNQVSEVIIIDGGSTDGTVEVASRYKDKFHMLSIQKTKTGVSIQRNFGVKQATYQNIIFLDADMELINGSLKKIIKHYDAGKVDFIAIPFIYPYNGKVIDYFIGTLAYIYFFAVKNRAPIVTGMCIFTTRSVHEKIGGFNEKMTHGEDIDYGIRAHRLAVPYYIFSDVRLRTSARRLDQNGRLNTALKWLNWHRQIAKLRNLDTQEDPDYKYGNFTK